jgi:hypothetical protein
MASNLVYSSLATHAQVFPVLTSAQISRIWPFASLRHATLGEAVFEADASDVSFFILLIDSIIAAEPGCHYRYAETLT